MSIPMTINLSLSGQPFNGPDIGGFDGNATPELFGHWIAVGAFYPFCRAHTANNTDDQEPWEFGRDIEIVSRTALERRYRLLPYLYTLFHEASTNGMPVMRPVFFADPLDPSLRREQEAFMLGSSLLVIPAWAEDPAIPDGTWRAIELDLMENQVNRKFQPELRLKAGRIIPAGPVVQSTWGYRLDPLTLIISLDEKGTAEGSLYEDSGDGYSYRRGEYLHTSFRAVRREDSVSVDAVRRLGLMEPPDRALKIVLVTDGNTFRGSGKEGETVTINLD